MKQRRSSDSHSGPYWLYGHHAVSAALNNEKRVQLRLCATRNALRKLPSLPSSLQFDEVSSQDLTRLLGAEAVHQGLALQTEPLDQPDIDDVKGKLVVVLDQVSDPHNIGAIMRSAAACGASALINTERHATGETAVLCKAASGAFELVPYIQIVNLSDGLNHLQKKGFWCIGLEGEVDLTLEDAMHPHDPVALVLGAEGKGLRHKTRHYCHALARIHLPGSLKSLNVSNAAAIALYVAARRDK
jgi:23S rRNA (guanosine2251-2'-O)-methyltransferase